MYNIKLKHYQDGETQTKIYSHPVRTDYTLAPPDKTRYLEVEPFGGTLVRTVDDFSELDRMKERSLYNSLRRAKQNIYDISRANKWEYFITLTFDPAKVDRYDYGACSKKLSKWLDNTRQRVSPEFRYLIVPERHKDGAFHFHGLISHCEGLQLSPSGHTDGKGKIIYNIRSYGLGFTTATQVESNQAVTKYITKYTTKDLVEHIKGKRKYWASRNCDRPIEEDFLISYADREQLHNELTEDANFYKTVEYEVQTDDRAVSYYENDGLTLNLD